MVLIAIQRKMWRAFQSRNFEVKPKKIFYLNFWAKVIIPQTSGAQTLWMFKITFCQASFDLIVSNSNLLAKTHLRKPQNPIIGENKFLFATLQKSDKVKAIKKSPWSYG
jgi:hypothetical protein